MQGGVVNGILKAVSYRWGENMMVNSNGGWVVYVATLCVISGFRRNVDEICALLGYYAAQSGNSVPTFRDNICSIFKGQEVILTPEDGTDRFRNVGTELPLCAA
jgi:hypothetical protein